MEKRINIREVHLKCDICGAEEVFKEKINSLWTPGKYGWSTLEHHKGSKFFTEYTKTYDLCPTCTRKLEKLIKKVTFDKEEI